MQVRGKNFSVIGGARSGRAVARLLQLHGAAVFLSDSAPDTGMGEAKAELDRLGIPYEFGENSARVLHAECLVLSPGVPSDAPRVREALARGLAVVSEIEVASWYCPSPIVAITGTNGKTTTTTLTGRMFTDAKRPCVVAGNIGTAFSQFVSTMTKDQTAILEISSFQLDFIASFRPSVAVLLNITPDHLNRYGQSFEKYIDAKCRIFEQQREGDTLIYNLDDEVTRKAVEGRAPRGVRLLPFSIEAPSTSGAFVRDGFLTTSVEGKVSAVVATEAISIPGRHNLYNAMAATLAATTSGIPAASLRATLKDFKGVEHRLEFVRELDGVTYVNDSKGTNVDAVWYALQSYHTPIILLLGGRDKGNDYRRLFDLVRKNVKAIVAIGESADTVVEAFTRMTTVTKASSMEEAVSRAAGLASPGDVVLLSPACASFDWFENYEHRGRVFKQAVATLEARA